jgi:acetyl esterase/lipase
MITYSLLYLRSNIFQPFGYYRYLEENISAMKYHIILIIIVFSSFFISCQKDKLDDSENSTLSAKTILNAGYGSNASQAMDIYLPANRNTSTTKSMILIHGGGWISGDKNDPLFLPTVDTLKRRLPGYAIFNINYRLSASPDFLFPTQEMDVKAAVEFIYTKRNEYGISDQFVLAGASAGAHLAMLQAYKYNNPVKAKAVVSLFGIGDLAQMYNNPVGGNVLISALLAQAVGSTPLQDPLIYSSSSPINFISNGTAMPTILLHGSLDPLVSPQQSAALQNKLNTAGIINRYILYPTAGHGDWDNATYSNAYSNIQAFLTLHVP